MQNLRLEHSSGRRESYATACNADMRPRCIFIGDSAADAGKSNRPIGRDLSGLFLTRAKNLSRHPHRRNKHMRRIREKCRLVPLDQVTQPC